MIVSPRGTALLGVYLFVDGAVLVATQPRSSVPGALLGSINSRYPGHAHVFALTSDEKAEIVAGEDDSADFFLKVTNPDWGCPVAIRLVSSERALWCLWGRTTVLKIIPLSTSPHLQPSDKAISIVRNVYLDQVQANQRTPLPDELRDGAHTEISYLGIGHNLISLVALTLFPISLAWIPAAISPRRHRLERGQCPKCAYSLAGVSRVGDRVLCPECGTPWDTIHWRETDRPSEPASPSSTNPS